MYSLIQYCLSKCFLREELFSLGHRQKVNKELHTL